MTPPLHYVDLHYVCRPPSRRELDVDKLTPDKRSRDQHVELIQSDKIGRGYCDNEG